MTLKRFLLKGLGWRYVVSTASTIRNEAMTCLQIGSMQLQMGASAAVEAMMADSRGCASRMVCRACIAADKCSLCRLSSSAFS